MQPTVVLGTLVPSVPPVTPLAEASRAPGCVSAESTDEPLVTCVADAVAAPGPALRHSAAPPVRVPRFSFAGRG
jgi:hypothetical protein